MRPAAASPNRWSASPNVAAKVRHSQRGMIVSTEPLTQTALKLTPDPPRVNYPLRRIRTTPPPHRNVQLDGGGCLRFPGLIAGTRAIRKWRGKLHKHGEPPL